MIGEFWFGVAAIGTMGFLIWLYARWTYPREINLREFEHDERSLDWRAREAEGAE